MKTIKKLWAVVLAVMLMLCMSFGLVGCDEKKGPIPNGNYAVVSVDEMLFKFTEKSVRDPYGWEIEGDIAEEWVSGSCDYKAKIVEKDGKIYFEGYTWKSFLSSKKRGHETVYEVVYDEGAQTITLMKVKSEE